MSQPPPPRRLLLIRHSIPEIVEDQPASTWRLGPAGRDASVSLAEKLRAVDVRAIYASQEPKAAETAALLGSALGIAVQVRPRLHEHERSSVPWLGVEEFRRQARGLFDRPDELVFGDETAKQACDRFEAAVARCIASTPDGDVAIVAHGTVIALFVSRHNPKVDVFELWRRLGMPGLTTVDLDSYALIH